MKNPLTLLSGALLALAVGAGLYGQAITGTLTGIVMDSSEAVIPGAQITMTNDASGVVRRSESNADGYFAVAGVTAGAFTVEVRSEGFSVWQQTGIVFNPGDARHLSDIQLQVGSTTETITVSAVRNTLAPVESGEKSAVITEQQLQDIPVVGRSAAEFIRIMPGMSPTGSSVESKPGFSGQAIGINGNGDGGRQSALGYYAANGTNAQSMQIVGDGSNASDPGCNCATPVNPNVDMIQEFKVLMSNYSAEHSKGPVVMNFVTKSGGKDYHGTAYYILRHYKMNANEFQLNSVGQERPKNKYQFPGFNIGGPVLIPGTNFNKDRDKLFFFAGYEFFQQTIDTGVLNSIVPTADVLGGDFSNTAALGALGSGQVSNGLDNTEFPNGTIPQSMIDPSMRSLMGLITPANVDPAGAGAGNNYVQALTLDQNMQQFTTKVDVNFSDYSKMFVRYNRQDEKQNFPVGLWWRQSGQVPYPTSVVGDNVSDSLAFGLTNVFNPTMTNEVTFGLTHVNFPNSFADPSAVSRSAVGYTHPGIFKNSLDQIPSINGTQGVVKLFNPGGFDPVLFAQKYLWTISDNFTMVKGTHTIKLGGFWEAVTNNQPGNNNSNGRLDFDVRNNSISTGNAFGDMLLGRTRRVNESTANVLRNIQYNTLDGYLQDSWKVTPGFTLDFGVRLQYLDPWYDRDGSGLAFFDFARASNNPDDLGDLSGLISTSIDPGIPTSGRFSHTDLFVAPRFGFAWDLFGSGKTVVRGGFGAFRYHDPQGAFPGAGDVPKGVRSTSTGEPLTLAQVDNFVPSATRIGVTTIDPNDDTQPLNYNWNFSIANRLKWGTIWEVAYVGNKSRNLVNSGFQDQNRVPIGAMLNTPGANANNFRPFVNWTGINVIGHALTSDYHALQTTISKQTGVVNYTASYTFSKTTGIRTNNVTDQFNFQNNHGVLGIDRPHLFNLSYVLNLPNFAANAGMGAGAKALLDGWQVSGITSFSSGSPLQATASSNFGLNGQVLAANGETRNVDGIVINGTNAIQAQPHIICDPTEGVSGDRRLNPDCFAMPSVGNNGTLVFPSNLRSRPLVNHDLSVYKDFEISEGKKFQFRLSAFNFLNHPVDSFRNGDPNLRLNFNPDGSLANRDTFGRTSTKFGRRILQIGLKFFF